MVKWLATARAGSTLPVAKSWRSDSVSARLANGQPYENRYFFRFRIDDGRIAEVWEYLDTLRQHELGVFG